MDNVADPSAMKTWQWYRRSPVYHLLPPHDDRESMRHIKPFFSSPLLALTLPASAKAVTEYYWTDSSGQVVRDSTGNCVGALYHGTRFPE